MFTSDLKNILGPFTPQEFVAEYLGKRFLYVPGAPEKFAALLKWDALNDLLEHNARNIVLIKDGKKIPPEEFFKSSTSGNSEIKNLRAPEFTTLLREGATLIFNSVDKLHRPIALLAHQLERIFDCGVGVNLYAAWRQSHGFDVHWDDHDVFIFQVSGKKRWQIFGRAERGLTGSEGEKKRIGEAEKKRVREVGPIWTGYMSQGDCLYIPREWWHFAEPCDEPTCHLTFGVYFHQGRDLARWLINTIRDESMREDLPLLGDSDAREIYLRRFKNAINNALLNADLLSEFISHRRTAAVPRTWFNLPCTATPRILPSSDDGEILLTMPRRLQVRPVEGGGDIEVMSNSKAYRFDNATTPLFEMLNETPRIQIKTFYARWESLYSREELEEFLSSLAENGMVMINP